MTSRERSKERMGQKKAGCGERDLALEVLRSEFESYRNQKFSNAVTVKLKRSLI